MSRSIKIRLIGWSVILGAVSIMMFASSQKTPRRGQQAEPGSPGVRVELFMSEELSIDQQIEAVKSGESDTIHVAATPVTDEDLAKLAGLQQLNTLQIDGGHVTDTSLQHLLTLKNLEHLRLRQSPVSDAGLALLSQLDKLRVLNLPQAKFSDVGLAHLKKLSQLELFRFSSPHVTDSGMATIAGFPSLKFLHLIQVPISDAALAHVEDMPNLQSFYVDGAKLTDEGISRLIQHCPKLHFHLDQGHHDLDPQKRAHTH